MAKGNASLRSPKKSIIPTGHDAKDIRGIFLCSHLEGAGQDAQQGSSI